MVREFYPIMPKAALAMVLNRTTTAVRNMAVVMGVRTSPETLAEYCRFKPGHASWNKGRKGWTAGGRSAETRFKRGCCNGRAGRLVVPVGTYRISSDGYLDRKIGTTPGNNNLRWKPVHRLVWIEAHGPIPAGHAVVFKQGRRTTELARITLDALELVTRQELMRRNSLWTRMPRPLAEVIQLRGALNRKIRRREKAA